MSYTPSLTQVIILVLLLAGCTGKKVPPTTSAGDSPVPVVLTNLPPQVRSFIERQEQSLPALAQKLGVEVDAPTLEFFAHARKGEFAAATRLAHELAGRRGKYAGSQKIDPNFHLPLWEPLFHVELTLEAYANGAGKFGAMCGEGIAKSIPPGGIYFAGNDAGYGLVAAFARPVGDGEPFILVSQNSFADGEYLQYLRAAFGDKAYMPSDEDSQRCFEEYLADSKRRLEHDVAKPNDPRQLKPGEDVKMVDGKVQINGQVAVMSINALAAMLIFNRNTNRECYYTESFPLDWMYPHLTPHGLIMKINREPLTAIPVEIVAKDHDYWTGKQKELIGDWLKPETSVKELCDFVEKMHVRKDLSGFQGDPELVHSSYTCAAFSKFRVSQAGLYSWRIGHSTAPDEQQRMIKEADFAFRQSFAFGPGNPEIVFRYVNLMVQLARIDDALLIASSASKTLLNDSQVPTLIKELERMKQQQTK